MAELKSTKAPEIMPAKTTNPVLIAISTKNNDDAIAEAFLYVLRKIKLKEEEEIDAKRIIITPMKTELMVKAKTSSGCKKYCKTI
eukprot:15365276-Ditylum_brightwellii.AAC.2